MKCEYCGNNEFVVRSTEKIWYEHRFIHGGVEHVKVEWETTDGGDWDGVFCSECDTEVNEKYEVEIDDLYDKAFE